MRIIIATLACCLLVLVGLLCADLGELQSDLGALVAGVSHLNMELNKLLGIKPSKPLEIPSVPIKNLGGLKPIELPDQPPVKPEQPQMPDQPSIDPSVPIPPAPPDVPPVPPSGPPAPGIPIPPAVPGAPGLPVTPVGPAKPKVPTKKSSVPKDKLSPEQIKASDVALISMLKEVSNYEFGSYSEMLKFVEDASKKLQSGNAFGKHEELRAIIEKLKKDDFGLEKKKTMDEETFFPGLLQRFSTGKKNDPVELLKHAWRKAIYDEAAFNSDATLSVLILAASIAAGQRASVPSFDVDEEGEEASDKLVLAKLNEFVEQIANGKTEGFAVLIQELSALRLHLTFLKYTGMFKRISAESKKEIKTPLLVLLRAPTRTTKLLQFKTSLKSHFFDDTRVGRFDSQTKELLKKSLEQQLAQVQKEKEKVQVDVKQYLSKALEKLGKLSDLKKILKILVEDYNQKGLEPLQKDLVEPKKSAKAIASDIISVFESILEKKLKAGYVTIIEKEIEHEIENKKIIKHIVGAKTSPVPLEGLEKKLSQELAKSDAPERVKQLANAVTKDLNNEFVTPQGIWNLFDKSLVESLRPSGFDKISFILNFPSFGILWLVLQHFINEVKRGARAEIVFKKMLLNSVQSINTSKIGESMAKDAQNAIAAWKKKSKEVPMNSPLAPVIVDRTLNGESKGEGFYSGQIKAGTLKGKLGSFYFILSKSKGGLKEEAPKVIVEGLGDLVKLNPKYYVIAENFDVLKSNLQSALALLHKDVK